MDVRVRTRSRGSGSEIHMSCSSGVVPDCWFGLPKEHCWTDRGVRAVVHVEFAVARRGTKPGVGAQSARWLDTAKSLKRVCRC